MTERTPIHKKNSDQFSLPFWRQLGWTLILSFVLLGILPVFIVTYVILIRTREQATTQIYDQLDSVAELKSDQILRWLDEGDLAMDTLLSGPNSERFSNFAASQFPDLQERSTLNSILAGAVKTQYFKRFFIYNTKGIVIAASDPADLGKALKDQPYFDVSLHADYIQSPFLDPAARQLTMYITRPLRGEKIQASGALAGELNIDSLAEIMTERTGLGSSGETYLVSPQNKNLLTPSRFEGYEMAKVYQSEGIDRALGGEKGRAAYTGYRTLAVFGSYRFIPELQAALLAEVDQSQALGTFRQVQVASIGVAFITMLIAFLVGFIASQRISRPIRALTFSAQRIGSGELKTEVVEVRRQDEIGVLARAFHQMQSELVASYEKLEQRVADRTKALATSAELSRRISTIMDRQQLINEVVERVNSAFNYYHTQVYFFEPAGNNLLLAGGTGEAGRLLLEKGHKIAKGAGLVGRAAETNAAVIVSDVAADPDWLPNALLPDTKSELAVPISSADLVIGVLDVQQNKSGGLTKEDADVLQSIASQIMIAAQNGRLLLEAQKRAEREALITSINQKIQNTTTVDNALQVAVREVGRALGAHSRVQLAKLGQRAENK